MDVRYGNGNGVSTRFTPRCYHLLNGVQCNSVSTSLVLNLSSDDGGLGGTDDGCWEPETLEGDLVQTTFLSESYERD